MISPFGVAYVDAAAPLPQQPYSEEAGFRLPLTIYHAALTTALTIQHIRVDAQTRRKGLWNKSAGSEQRPVAANAAGRNRRNEAARTIRQVDTASTH